MNLSETQIDSKSSDASDSSVSVLGSVSGEQVENGKVANLKSRHEIASQKINQKETFQEGAKNVEDDEEIRVAKAMALAIQNNPNLTPEEIRQLVGNSQKEQQENIAAVVANRKQQQPPIAILANSLFERKDEDKGKTLQPQSSQGKLFSANIQEFQKNIKGFVDNTANKAMNVKNKVITLNQSSLSAPSSPTHASKKAFNFGVKAESAVGFGHDSTQEEARLEPPDTSLAKSDEEEEKIILSSLVWKRRSGFGKYNTKAWERRRVVLKGNVLQYFKEKNRNDSEDTVIDMASSTSSIDQESKDFKSVNNNKTSNWLATNIENAKATMDKFAANVPHLPKDYLSGDDDPNAPRGAIDLVKEHATVGAAIGHSGSPTPFCLSVKVGKETKFKLCFDTHAIQMEWLAALTDIIVKSSVESHNKLHDTSHVLNTSASGQPKTFLLDNYTIRASIMPTAKEELDNDHDVKGRSLDSIISNSEDLCEEESESYYQISEMGVYIAATIINTALIMTQASTSTPSRFWYVATFANLGLYCLLSQPEVQKKTKKSGLKRRSVRSSITNMTSPLKSLRASTPKKIPPKAIRKSISKPGFKPQAGSTCVKVDSADDAPTKNNHRFIGWKTADPVQVRSFGYLSHKKKMSSLGPLYDVVAVDFFECSSRIPDMSSRVILPSAEFESKTKKRWHAPDIFVVTLSLPTDTPSAFGRATNDGGCYTASMYYKMGEETRKILERITANDYDPASEKNAETSMVNAVKLFDEWCRRAPSDDKFFSRMKMIFRGDNFKEIGVPNWIRQYNGKPVLIKRPRETGFVYNHPELNAMEFEITLHPFPYLAKQAICYLKEKYFKQLILTVGFVIEGRSDEELPECTIGAAQLCHPDPALNIQDDDLFEGTSPKSHEDE